MGGSFEEEEKYFYAFIYKVLHKGCPKINARFELNIELKRELVYINISWFSEDFYLFV